MALLDDLQRIISVQGTRNKSKAVESALWIFERNPWLSLDQQAAGIAFLVTAFLRETEPALRTQYRQSIYRILQSRPYQVGAQIDWVALTSALPRLYSEEISLVVYLLRYATDARYLSLLESYFDDLTDYRRAISSWIILAYTQRYIYDTQVLPTLQAAQKTIEEHFAHATSQVQHVSESRTLVITKLEHNDEWPDGPKAWAKRQLAEAEEHIRQYIQVRDRTAFMREYEEKRLNQTSPAYLPVMIRSWLTTREKEKSIDEGLWKLDWTFQYSLALPIDEVARSVEALVEYALMREDRSVNSLIWQQVAFAFEVRRYVGTYLDWGKLADTLFQFGADREERESNDLKHVLFCFGYAPDEHYLDVLKPFLDHPNSSVRWTAVKAIKYLLCHLAHDCAEAILLLLETNEILIPRRDQANTPERWQEIKDRLIRLEHDIYPYFHYYSI